MSKRWINTKVVLEWNGTQYIEKLIEGFWYEGELALADLPVNAGHGGGGGGGASGSGGVVVLLVSNLSAQEMADGKLVVEVGNGNVGAKGLAGGNENNGNAGNHGVAGNNGAGGTDITQII